jgi:hypothetical protein
MDADRPSGAEFKVFSIAGFGSVIWRIGNRQLEIDDVLT